MEHLDTPWHELEGQEAADACIAQFRYLDEQHKERRARNLDNTMIYMSRESGRMDESSDFEIDDNDIVLRRNLAKRLVEAMVARVASEITRPMALTIEGDRELRDRAERMQRYIDGQFYVSKQPILSMRRARWSLITGNGIQKIHPIYKQKNGKIIDGKIISELMSVDQIVIDETEAEGGEDKVRNLFEYWEVSKRDLVRLWPQHEDAIKTSGVLRERSMDRRHLVEPIGVVQAYLKPDIWGDGGRHIICIENKLLFEENWDAPEFPHVFQRWNIVDGWYGSGLVEEILSAQYEINEILDKIQQTLRYASAKTYVEKGSLSMSNLNNDPAAVVEYTGRPPVHVPIDGGIFELYAHINNITENAHDDTGINLFEATGRKPTGIESGKALEEYADKTTGRFAHFMLEHKDTEVEVAYRHIYAEKELLKYGIENTALAKSGNHIERLKFSEVNIDEDKFQLRVEPAPFFPNSVSGKIRMLESLGKVNVQLQNNLAKNLIYPDTEEAVKPLIIEDKLADKIILKAVKAKKAVGIEPYWPLDTIANKLKMSLAEAEIDDHPEWEIEILADMLDRTMRLIAEKVVGQQQLQAQIGAAMPQAQQSPGAPMGPGQTNT